MKKIVKYLMAVCLFAAATLSLSSCSKDEPSGENYSNLVLISYKVQLGEAWFKCYDVSFTYLDASGNEKSVAITNSIGYGDYVPVDKAPLRYACKVVAKIKTNLEIDDSKSYNFNSSLGASVIEMDTKGNAVKTYGTEYSKTTKLVLEGEKLSEYLTSNPEFVLMDYSATKE